MLSESDPEGCAACSARVYPQNAYRNGTLYPAYTAVMMKNILDSAARRGANIAGMLTWAFEFEGQDGFGRLRDRPAEQRIGVASQAQRAPVGKIAHSAYPAVLFHPVDEAGQALRFLG